MPPNPQDEITVPPTEELADKALRHLNSAEGQRALKAVADRSRDAAEQLRRARDIDPENLNQRFTV